MNDYAAKIRRLQELGPRSSGNDAHRALIEEVALDLTDLGLDVNRDSHSFERWDATPDQIGLTVKGRSIVLSSAWPYSGETPAAGVTGPLIMLRGRLKNWKSASGKIAVIEARNIDVPAHLLFDTWGGELPFHTLSNPVVGSELAGTDLARARKAGVLGVVAIWRDLPDSAAHAQYLPFTRDYQGIPAVWAPESEADALVRAAEAGEEATLTLAADRTPGASMDTLWAVSPGTGPQAKEAVLVVTHSDGGNAVEENGHLALLALAHEAVTVPHNRTIVFVYTAGHLRIPAVTKHGQATTAWLDKHPELWSPTGGGLHAVAGLAIEHLGAKHYSVDSTSGHYGPSGTLEPELLYATTAELAELVRSTWSGVEVGKGHPVKPGPIVQFGEGEPLLQHHIPAVSLITMPQYLLAETNDDVVDIDALSRQVDSFRKLQTHLAGSVDSSAFGKVTVPGKVKKLFAAIRAFRYASSH
ncbi:hypothetical protein [Rhodococcus sp. MALMAid1271]|uniref:hypothetical protein n=1 Tax=Rhodococcus sp. MALMAid1271 TaxID=3411744 RepID=UPI0030F4DC44